MLWYTLVEAIDYFEYTGSQACALSSGLNKNFLSEIISIKIHHLQDIQGAIKMVLYIQSNTPFSLIFIICSSGSSFTMLYIKCFELYFISATDLYLQARYNFIVAIATKYPIPLCCNVYDPRPPRFLLFPTDWLPILETSM